MAVRLTFMIIYLIVLCLLAGGAIVLQVYLSKKENKWLGLIMPGISLCLSLVVAVSMIMFSIEVHNAISSTRSQIITSNVSSSSNQVVISGIFILFITNIPTFILLTIYFGCRQKRRKNKEIEKMNIQDLE